jgi:hypothetical protein
MSWLQRRRRLVFAVVMSAAAMQQLCPYWCSGGPEPAQNSRNGIRECMITKDFIDCHIVIQKPVKTKRKKKRRRRRTDSLESHYAATRRCAVEPVLRLYALL